MLEQGSPGQDKLARTPEESIAQSIVHYDRDDDRARYLGLRASGFTIREALKLIGRAHSTLSLWRKNEEFVSLEKRLPEFKHDLALEYANLEFLRNFRLVLEKDYRILRKSLEKDAVLSAQEQGYLIKMRSQYTPQQLQIVETLINAELKGGGFNFTEFIVTASRIEQRIKLETKRGGSDDLSSLPETND